MKFPLLFPAIGIASGVAQAQATLFEDLPGRPGNVVVVGAAEERPPALQGIELLPLDFAGRTSVDEHMPDRPRRRTDIPDAARLVLPNARGSLYKYRRRDAGLTVYGLFRVDARGRAGVILELPGGGPLLVNDPLAEKVAVSADGAAILAATTWEAGGDLFELDLARGLVVNRTAQLAPLAFGRGGLALLDGWGVAMAASGLYRFPRTLTGAAELVPMSRSVRWFGPDVVGSADSSTVAFLAGDGERRAWVWIAARAGTARQVSDRAMHLPRAGFLPEDPTGPALAISTDGSWVAWRAIGDYSREVFARPTAQGNRATHLTGDANFYYTLDETGVITFAGPESLALVAGRAGANGIERADLFGFDLSQGFTPRNLSLSSGDTVPPFDYGYLRTSDGLHRVPASLSPGGAFVLFDRSMGGRLLWLDPAGTRTEIVAGVSRVGALAVVGDHVVAGVTRPPGIHDPLVETLDLVQIPPGGTNAIVVPLPDCCDLTREVGSSTTGVYAAVLEQTGGDRLGILPVPSPSGIVAPVPLDFGPTMGFADDGSVLGSVDIGSEYAAFVWTRYGPRVLRVQNGAVFVLPGL